jgi:long-subunit fatty acid transport protein
LRSFLFSFVIAGTLFYGATLHSLSAGGGSVYGFIGNDASARIAAIGGSAVALRHDPMLVFYNPAGLYNVTGQEVSVSYFRHVVDINTGFISYTRPIGKYGWIGGGIVYADYGSMTEIDINENVLGTYNPSELALAVSYANRLYGENVAYGVSLKLFYSGLTPNYTSTGVALDLGIQYYIPEQELTIGASLLNAGRQITTYGETRESLPIDFKFGVSKKLEHLPLLLNLNFHHVNEERTKAIEHLRGFTVGGEFTISEAVRLRLGYRNEMRRDLKIGTTIGLEGFAAGFGVHVSTYKFDYSFTSLGKIGAFHHITLGYTF